MYAFLQALTRLQALHNVSISGLFIGTEGVSMQVKIVGRSLTPPIRVEGLFERTIPNNNSDWDEAFSNLTRVREAEPASNDDRDLGETQPEMHERRNYP